MNVEKKELELEVGQEASLESDDIQNFAVSEAGFVDVRVSDDGRRLIITAQQAGATSILLVANNGDQTTIEVHIAKRAPRKKAKSNVPDAGPIVVQPIRVAPVEKGGCAGCSAAMWPVIGLLALRRRKIVLAR